MHSNLSHVLQTLPWRIVSIFVTMGIFLLRTHLSRGSSGDSESVSLSPVELQHRSDTYSDVFLEPTDCHAAHCPIHQRYGGFTHEHTV